MTGLPAPAVAAYRLGLGGLVLVVLATSRSHSLPRGRPVWTRIVNVGLLAAVFQSAYFTAVGLSSVSSATLITIGSAPLFVVAHDVLRRRALPSLLTARPVAAGVVGLGLLIAGGDGAGLGSGSVAGSALALLSGSAFAAFTLMGRQPVPAAAITVVGFGFLVGSAVIALCAFPVVSFRFSVTPESFGLLTLFATGPTALAYTLYFRALTNSTPATATVVALLEPLTATVLAVTVVGEKLSVVGVVGAALLVGSVLDKGVDQWRSTDRPHSG